MSKVVFDMPHALVTLTTVETNVEIEVWPKAGQSAYVVVPPEIAREIATRLLTLADELAAARDAAAETDETSALPELDPEAESGIPMPSNVVDLAKRRRRPN